MDKDNNNSDLVVVDGVTFSYGPRKILDNLSLHIPRGQVVVIMGGSGCGKSTLLSLLGGRLKPDSGRLLVDGQSVPDLNNVQLFDLRKRMGMLFQNGALLTDLSLFENVAFPMREHTRLPESIMRKIVLMKLERVGLRGAHALMPSEISGGMARRAALARAIALEPNLVMYDEPFVGLDPISKGVIAKLIRELNQHLGITSIVVSHDVEDTCAISDYAYLLGKGTVLAQGTPDEVRQSASAEVRQFMDGLPDGPVPYQYPAPEYVADLTGGVLA